MIVYSFDVDETLEVSDGPVTLQSLLELRKQGHIVGLCGNLNAFCTRVPNWQDYISFTLNLDFGHPVVNGGNFGGNFPKEHWLKTFQLTTFPDAEDYCLVGNVAGVSGASDDQGAAMRSGWRFISEREFADGKR
jgi:hypothetical protein